MGQVADIIRGEIRKQAAISFGRFMELALYCPLYGYYEAEGDKIGRRGDYYTSVSVGSLFGELLARQFLEWAPVPQPGRSGAVELIEAGAHDGALARDILQYLKQTPGNRYAQTCYTIVEPSERRKARQQKTLAGYKDKIKWVPALGSLAKTEPAKDEPFRIIFCNELLDAMPVHRVFWDTRQAGWFEWGVTGEDGSFAWTKLPLTDPRVQASLERIINLAACHRNGSRRELEAILPDGYTVELCPAAETWWSGAADCLRAGKLMAIDYGFGVEGLFRAERREGTVRAYQSHQVSADVLAMPGQQDLTAHVSFSALEDVGCRSGLITEQFTTQELFLTAIAVRGWRSQRDLNPDRTRQFRTLTHPEHLGSKFRVLVQSRAVPVL